MISYAGVELLLDNPAGEVQAWLDQFLPLDDLRLVSDWTAARLNKSGGLPLPNYSQPLKPQLNTWYRPTGASRWAFGLFLATTAQKYRILSSVGSVNTWQPLILEINGLFMGWDAYLLPPRPISAEISDPASLWIIPLVDERYYWQFIAAPQMALTDADSWVTQIDVLRAAVGLSVLNVDTTSLAQYGYPNAHRINGASYASAAVMLDALAHSLGQRILLKYEPAGGDTYYPLWYHSAGPASWRTKREINFSQPYIGALQSGFVSAQQLNLAALLPSSVQVVFRKWANGIVWDDEYYVKTITAGTLSISGTTSSYVKTIKTTALANYTAGGGSPDNQSACDALALQIATDFYESIVWVQDSIYLGFGRWFETGFDDYIEYTLARVLPDGTYTAQTRVHTVPYNFGVEEMLHQLASTHEYGEHVMGVLNADLAALGTAVMKVYEGSPPADTGRTVTVTNISATATAAAADPITAIKIGKLWIADVGSGSGTGTPNLLGTAVAFKTEADATGSFTTSAGTKTATIPRGLVLQGSEYLLVWAEGDHYEVSNPELSVVAKATTTKLFANTGTFTVYTGTAGAETTTSHDLDAYIRKGLVFAEKFYTIDWIESGWKCADPALEFVGTASSDIALNATQTQLIFTGTLGGESSSGISTSVKNTYGAISSGARTRAAWCDWAGAFEYVNAKCSA